MMAAPGPDPDGVGQPELDGITGPDGHPEVIRAQFADPPAARAGAWLRAHPRLRFGLIGLAAIAAAAALAVAVRAGARLVSGPRLPDLRVTAFEDRPEVTTWVARADGRPEGPLVLSMLVTLRLAQPTDIPVSVLGLSGPGVVEADDEPAPIPTGMRVWTADLRTAVDCGLVPATPTPTAYRLRLAVRAGSRTVERSTSLGPAGSGWITSVQDACASWQARRDLTVTAVAAVTDLTRTRTTLTLVVTNTGRQPALLGPVPVCCEVSVQPAAPLRVPALSAASAAFTVVLERCDTVTGPVGGAAPLTTDPRLSSEIGLVALAGPRLPSDLTGFVELDPTIDGFGPTGVVFGREAAVDLADALHQACGGIGPITTLTSFSGARFDRRTGLLTVPVEIHVTPGRVRNLRFKAPGPEGDREIQPRWTTGALAPDRTGQVRTVLRYRVLGGCLPADGLLDGPQVTLAVPEGARVREVNYGGDTFAVEQFAELQSQLCPPG